MVFDPNRFLADEPATGFDPNAFLSAPDEPTVGESALRGGAQGLTLGFADEITGAGESLVDKLTGSREPLADLYNRNRDESRANYRAAKEANPKTYLGSEIGGSILPIALAPEAAGIKGAMAVGAGAGAVSALGGDENDLTTNQGQLNAAKSIALQSIIGAGVGGAGHYVAGKFNPTTLERTAELNATKAAGALGADFARMGEKEARAVGRTLLDTDVIRPGFSGTQEMADKIDDVASVAGRTIGSTMDVIDDAGLKVYRPKNALDSFLTKSGEDFSDPMFKPLSGKIDSMTESLAQKTGTGQTMNQARRYKTALGRMAYGEKSTLQPGQEITDLARRSVGDELERAVGEASEKMGDPDLLSHFGEANRTYTNLSKADPLMEKRFGRELGNATVGPLEMMAGAAVKASGGDTFEAGVTAGAWKMARKYGNQNVAWSADRIAKTIQFVQDKVPPHVATTLKNAAQRGGNAFAVANYLMQQQSPEYSEALKNMGDQQ